MPFPMEMQAVSQEYVEKKEHFCSIVYLLS